MLGLETADQSQPVPVGHQTFHEVVGLLVVRGRKLGGVRGIKVGQVHTHFRQQTVYVLPAGLALLAVVPACRAASLWGAGRPFAPVGRSSRPRVEARGTGRGSYRCDTYRRPSESVGGGQFRERL